MTVEDYLAGLERIYTFNEHEIARIGLIQSAEQQLSISQESWPERKKQIVEKLKPMLFHQISRGCFDYVAVFQDRAYGCRNYDGEGIDVEELEAISGGLKPIIIGHVGRPQDVTIKGNYL